MYYRRLFGRHQWKINENPTERTESPRRSGSRTRKVGRGRHCIIEKRKAERNGTAT